MSADAPFNDTQLYDVTAMFCDLVGSTELSTVLDSEDFSDAVRGYHDAVADVVEQFGGSVNQIAGDGVLVLFGYPRADETAAEQAIRASLEIFNIVSGLGLRVRIGLHSGPCIVTTLRPGSPQGTLALGETLNTASRVQTVAEPGSVLMSDATHRLLAGWFEVESVGLHQLKGLPAPVELFRVLGPSATRSRLDVRGSSGFTRFVGRHAEREELARLWELACDGDGHVALISGEPGIGKSRLARAFGDDIADQTHLWLEGSSSPFTLNTAFHPIIGLVERLLGFKAELTDDERMARLTDAAERLGLSAEATALIAALLSLPMVPTAISTTLDRLGPEARRERTLDGLVAWVGALSGRQPVVLVIEDLHWCDPSTLELVRRVIEGTTDTRILTVLTARPEFQPPWLTHVNVYVLALARITDEESSEIVGSLASLPPETCAAVVRRADGVPLFVEELTAMIVESHIDSGRRSHSVADVPATLHGSLLARLDRLGAAKEIAQIASVIGRQFTRELLTYVRGDDADDLLDRALAELLDAGLVLVGTVPNSFAFKHALVQDVAYQSLLKKPRATLHGRVLASLRDHFPERIVTEPEVAARHAEAAGLLTDAVSLFRSAASQAIRRSAHTEAVGHLRCALEVTAHMSPGVERDRLELALHRVLAGSLIQTLGYHHGDTMSAWQRVSDLSLELDDPESHGGALLGLAVGTYCAGHLDESIPRIDAAFASAVTRQHDVHMIAACNEYATALHAMGRFREALSYTMEAVARYDPARHHEAIVALLGDDSGISAIGTAGWALTTLGYLDQGLAYSNRAVATAESVGHPFSIAQARVWRIAALMDRGSPTAASEAALTLAYAEEQGLALWVAPAKMLAGTAATDYELAMEGVMAASLTGLMIFASSSVHNIAELQLKTGRLDEVLGTLEFGRSISRDTNQPFYDARLAALKGDALVDLGVRDGAPALFVEAEQSFREAISIAQSQEAKTHELMAASRFSRFLVTQGRTEEAHAMLRPLYDSFSEGYDAPRLREVAGLLTDLERGYVSR